MNCLRMLQTANMAIMMALCLMTGIQATMPPAPPEWYQRIKVPIPEGIKSGLRPDFEKLERDLALATQKRPNNTDNLLLILVEFSDNPADQISHPPQAYENMMFSTGIIPTGSLVEYYQEISYGAFTPAGTVTVWITAPNPYSYYSESNGMGSYPNNSQGLLEDCVNLLDAELDFSQFDNNGDGYAEGIFLVHAGPGAEETGNANDIWSHAWHYEVETDDGVYTGRYSIEPEEFMDGSMIAIGVYCHEYGHVLGMPDLYDYDGTSEGVGVYCLMSGGSWGALPGTPERPTHMSAELKRRLNWMTPIDVTGSLKDMIIPPAATSSTCYRINHPTDPDQYFLIENRAKVGFDSLFRGNGGLAIWHIDHNGYQNDEIHPYVALEQADGNFDLMRDYGGGNRHPRTNRGDAGDLYPGQADNHYFTFSSHPGSYDYDIASSFATLDNIEYDGDSIRVDIYAVPDVPLYRFDGMTVNDDLPANGPIHNEEADSGEIVDVVVTLACEGEGALNLVGDIISGDSRISIVKNHASFAASTHNAYTTNMSDPFQMQILSSSTDSAVTCNLQLSADGDPYELPFTLNINRQKILVVLDNNESHWSDNLAAAMQRSGSSCDIYRVTSADRLTYDDLIPYHAVLWTTASYFGRKMFPPHSEFCLNVNEIAILQAYLDNGGRLGLFSQDYLYDRGFDAFVDAYLHIAGATQNQEASGLEGVSGTPFDGYVGSQSEWSFYDYTDYLTSAHGAVSVMRDAGSGSYVMLNYPSTPLPGSYAITFSAFSIERLDDASLESFLMAWCDWILTDINIDVPLPTSPKNHDIVSSAPVFMWTVSPGAVSYHLQIAADFEFANIIRDTSVPSNTTAFAQPFESGTYYWRVNASPDSKVTTAYSPRSEFVIYPPYVCGNANGDGDVNVGDAVFLIAYIFKGGPAPDLLCVGDANGDGDVNVGDAVYLIAYVFKGGPPPVESCCP